MGVESKVFRYFWRCKVLVLIGFRYKVVTFQILLRKCEENIHLAGRKPFPLLTSFFEWFPF